MNKDLSNITYVPRIKQMGNSCGAWKVISCTIDNIPLILKYHGNKKFYNNEKKIYLLLKNETFLPRLKYFDDKNLILCLTDEGENLIVHKNKMKKLNKKFSLKDHDKQLATIIDTLSNKYGLYHNDLRPKNICIDDNNNIKLIDFDQTSNIEQEDKYIFRTNTHGFDTL